MTLLPSVDTLILPKLWKSLDATDELIDAIVRKTNEAHSPEDRPSLGQVSRFENSVSVVEQFTLDWANPFLALPHIRSFHGTSCVATGDDGHRG